MTNPDDRAMAPGCLVIGAAGSGKSAYAEQLCVRFAKRRQGRLCYLATMPDEGVDARKRIERHRKLREGKGFETFELPRLLLDTDKAMLARARESVVLIECLGTLVSNELFGCGDADGCRCGAMDDAHLRHVMGDAAWVACLRASDGMDEPRRACLMRTLAGVASWIEAADEVVIVTNDVFADDGAYDEGTLGYRAVLGAANRVLAQRCANVVEVVCGIPVAVKGDPR